MAYCSLSVNVGSFNDPPKRPGLAHFLEHMVFLGSKEYPDEGAYGDHIGKYGGYANAETMFERTNYTFDCSYSGLEKAIDMMASNLAAPLLNSDSMDREVEAIESEF